MSLHPTFVEYMDGARLYLETETDKDNISIREVKIHFCDFIRKMIKNFSCKLINIKKNVHVLVFKLQAIPIYIMCHNKSVSITPITKKEIRRKRLSCHFMCSMTDEYNV